VSITWDEIRNTFYSRVSRNQILHTYVQSKPVNDVVYGQVVFDKTSLANKMLKEGPIKVPLYGRNYEWPEFVIFYIQKMFVIAIAVCSRYREISPLPNLCECLWK
jgi:hypothetical protein